MSKKSHQEPAKRTEKGDVIMKKALALAVMVVFLGAFSLLAHAGEKAPQKVVDLANSELAKLGTDAVIVTAVKEENAKGKTLDEIKAMDEKWKATPGIVDYMQALMDSDCGKHLREIQSGADYYAEIFVMDNQGANVCMTDKTSDYWQGDEAKFKESYKDGQGAVFVDEVEFDDSTQAYLVQVSVPVKEGADVIGAVTIGIDVDKVE
jgi:cell fate (sporulation/competence/biofilm development) regulator YmcA (YheA/YmcA/DUF963 family)